MHLLASLPVNGLCRFSYPTEGGTGFKKTNTVALYDEARLEWRMRLFETLCAPSLAVQSDQNFRLTVLAGENLPSKWRDRLEAVAEAVPQITLAFEPEGQHHRDVCVRLMLAMRPEDASVCAEFRLDDDDAVAFDYIARIRESFSQISGIIKQSPSAEINFVNSLWLVMGDGPFRGYVEPMRHLTSAQAFFFKTHHGRTMFNFAHHTAWQHMPTLTIPGRVMSLRGVHDGNDSLDLTRQVSRKDWLAREELSELLLERFGLELEGVSQALFA